MAVNKCANAMLSDFPGQPCRGRVQLKRVQVAEMLKYINVSHGSDARR